MGVSVSYVFVSKMCGKINTGVHKGFGVMFPKPFMSWIGGMDRLIERYQIPGRPVPFNGLPPLAVVRQQIAEQSRRLREFHRDSPRRLAGLLGLPMPAISRRWEPTSQQQPAMPRRTPPPTARTCYTTHADTESAIRHLDDRMG